MERKRAKKENGKPRIQVQSKVRPEVHKRLEKDMKRSKISMSEAIDVALYDYYSL